MTFERAHSAATVTLLLSSFALTGCIQVEQASAYLRVLNASPDYASLDLYVDDDAQLQSIAFDATSAYADVEAGEHEFALAKTGVGSYLSAEDLDLDDESHATLVAYGSTGEFATVVVPEEFDIPDNGEAAVQVLNAAPDAGSLDVYLTAEGVSLDDVSATFSGLEAGNFAADEPTVLDRGTYRLRVTAAGSKTDVRFDATGFTLANRAVGNLVIVGTLGGVLVDVAWLPADDEVTFLRNAQARMRAAVATSGTGAVQLKCGGTTIVSAAAPGALGTYKLVTAGTTTLDIAVDGTAALSQSVELTGGGDYTVLVGGTGAVPSAALLTESNRLPPSGYGRVRVVNGMYGLDAPVSAALDYSPIVEGLAVGAATLSDDVLASTSSRLDVTNASTAAALYYLTDLTLASQGVYTLALAGSQSATTAVLRKDR